MPCVPDPGPRCQVSKQRPMCPEGHTIPLQDSPPAYEVLGGCVLPPGTFGSGLGAGRPETRWWSLPTGVIGILWPTEAPIPSHPQSCARKLLLLHSSPKLRGQEEHWTRTLLLRTLLNTCVALGELLDLSVLIGYSFVMIV